MDDAGFGVIRSVKKGSGWEMLGINKMEMRCVLIKRSYINELYISVNIRIQQIHKVNDA